MRCSPTALRHAGRGHGSDCARVAFFQPLNKRPVAVQQKPRHQEKCAQQASGDQYERHGSRVTGHQAYTNATEHGHDPDDHPSRPQPSGREQHDSKLPRCANKNPRRHQREQKWHRGEQNFKHPGAEVMARAAPRSEKNDDCDIKQKRNPGMTGITSTNCFHPAKPTPAVLAGQRN